eukprot:SAG31_NODE_2652_length_5296_cov_7.770637_1_plen_90_part_00
MDATVVVVGFQPGNLEVWKAQLSGHRLAVSLLNRSPTAQNVTAHWAALGLPNTATKKVRDIWAAADVGDVTGSYEAEVPAFGVVLLVLS